MDDLPFPILGGDVLPLLGDFEEQIVGLLLPLGDLDDLGDLLLLLVGDLLLLIVGDLDDLGDLDALGDLLPLLVGDLVDLAEQPLKAAWEAARRLL